MGRDWTQEVELNIEAKGPEKNRIPYIVYADLSVSYTKRPLDYLPNPATASSGSSRLHQPTTLLASKVLNSMNSAMKPTIGPKQN